MMTEGEAKEKWCPHMRLGDEQGASASCIGSACMAWRWLREFPIRGVSARGDAITGIMLSDDDKPLGYCGLAGAPS